MRQNFCGSMPMKSREPSPVHAVLAWQVVRRFGYFGSAKGSFVPSGNGALKVLRSIETSV